MNKEAIKRDFSRYAEYYDSYCNVQNFAASNLISRLNNETFSSILDIGCGTGNYTGLLRMRFPGADIKAIDISAEMIEIARGKLPAKKMEFITADAETMNFTEDFDLISSNATFQWFEDLEAALSKYRRLLKDKGVVLFSVFGPRTFYELDETLKELFGENTAISSSNFIKRAAIAGILKGLFKETQIQQRIYTEKHSSLPELLKIIKYTGTRGNGINSRSFWTRKTVRNLEKIYKEKFKGIKSTYQVFFCRGVA